MQNTNRTFSCVKCYTVTRVGWSKRMTPGILCAGRNGLHSCTAFLYFDIGCPHCFKPKTAFLRLFVQNAQLGGRYETVHIRPVLPCGAPAPFEADITFEVGRSFRGWKSVDILPIISAFRRERHDAPFGVTLSVFSPSIISFSPEAQNKPCLVLSDPEASSGISGSAAGSQGGVLQLTSGKNADVSGAVDVSGSIDVSGSKDVSGTINVSGSIGVSGIAAGAIGLNFPGTFIHGVCTMGIHVETQTWRVSFIKKDETVSRRVDRMREGTFFISNTGTEPMLATVETSPDASHWAHDTQKKVGTGETQAIVAKYYGRYYRLVLTADDAGEAFVEFIGQYYAKPCDVHA